MAADRPTDPLTNPAAPRADLRPDDGNDVENPPEPPPLPGARPSARFASDQHARVSEFLQQVFVTGRLGSGPTERVISRIGPLLVIARTIPWTILILQLVWSSAVLGIAYALRPTNPDGSDMFSSLSHEYWTSKLNVSSSIAYGVGWALFVLLGFFVREANARYKEAQFTIDKAMSLARQLFRQLRQIFPRGMWHPGDTERIAAHLVALPIALKMQLRGERERAQLDGILEPDDLSDVLDSSPMHIQCTRVLRAYLSAAEHDAPFAFVHAAATESVDCEGERFTLPSIIDSVDGACAAALRIANFRPAAGYVAHMRNFLYIWSFFLPLVLVKTSGWFTPLWSILITYCIAMLYSIGEALNEPFGFDIQDVNLNHICADWAHQFLSEHALCKYSMKDNVLKDHDTPAWLEQPCENDSVGPSPSKSFIRRRMRHAYKGLARNFGTGFVVRNLVFFIIWLFFVVFLTWGLANDDNGNRREVGDRWWSLYLPISTNTTGFISLGVFLLLGFWMNDAYGRYWDCMQLWNATIRPGVEGIATLAAMIHHKGFWHSRDRERLLSFFVAFIYSVKLHLRQSRDVSELEGVLDPRDLQALVQAPNLPNHCLNVIFGYVNSADCMAPGLVQGTEKAMGLDVYTITFKMWEVEDAVTVCDATRKYPMSLSFTLHLFAYVTFWLALLPLSLVKENGFLTFVFIIPVAYAIINLLSIGVNLSDPFGFDAEDIPMDRICDEVKAKIHRTYHEIHDGIGGYILEEPYDRSNFMPSLQRGPTASRKHVETSVEKRKRWLLHMPRQREDEFTIWTLVKNAFDRLPEVNPIAQICATVWSIIAVVVSWRLSKLSDEWHTGIRGNCQEWCSPIDVDGDTLANIGYALFMLLSFRASDAIGRYEDGAELVYELKLQLHTNAVEFIGCFRQDYFHAKDRERFIAHLVQVPLLIRDRLLKGEGFDPISDDCILSANDKLRMAESTDPIDHVLRTLDSYVILLDRKSREPFTSQPLQIFHMTTYLMSRRFQELRKAYAGMLSVKTFPIISRYANHQYVFAALWLGLLPLYMTKQTGFFTILWAPIISYGVFALQAIAEKLVDPFGEDAIDIPVQKLLTETAEEILTTVRAHDWDCLKYASPSPLDTDPKLGARLVDGGVMAQRNLAYLEEHEATVDNFGMSPLIEFKSSKEIKLRPNLLVHLVESVPWWTIITVVAWTTIGCAISYATRDRSVTNVRWWKSGISVGTNVATYVSFAAFILLSFYVQAAFRRYTQAGTVWGDNLRASLHSFAVASFNLFQDGYIHEDDQKRIMSHIAALPLVLKHELRDSRDLREVNGLLSGQDIARIQSAPSMTTHCVDVLRAYKMQVMHHQDRMLTRTKPIGTRVVTTLIELGALHTALRSARFLNEFDIAPGFIVLLNSLLVIWFMFLPFVMAEISGWFTILWVAIIAYGVLGMYAVAAELQSPFGLDVNDLDLDKIADFIVRDILFVQKNYKAGNKVLARPSSSVPFWSADTANAMRPPPFDLEKSEMKSKRSQEEAILALEAVSPFQMIFNAVWAALSVAFAYGTSKWFAINDEICRSIWFCTSIAVDGSLMGFIGFALFLLLGFRLYDSHARYVMAIRLWQDEMVGKSRTLATRLLSAYPPGTFHDGDSDRMCGHIAAFAVCAMGALRGEDYKEQLSRVVSAEDVKRILSATERIDYCMDVVRAYVFEGNWMTVTRPGSEPCGVHDTKRLQAIILQLAQSAYESRRLIRIPLPFGYVKHLKIFLYIWLLLLPLSLVEATGWLTILWVVIIAYGVFGVEHWSEELSDPFGYDISDVPLEKICNKIIGEVKSSHAMVKGRGVGAFIHPGRSGFPQPAAKVQSE